MSRFRFSIAGILRIVLFVALAVAALRSATDAWDSGVFGLTLLAFLAAVPLAIYRANGRRAFWLGFALFGWAYLSATLIGPVEPRLPTSKLFSLLGSQWPRAIPAGSGVAFADLDNDGSLDLFVARGTSMGDVYLNKGDGTFVDVSASSGLAAVPNANGNIMYRSMSSLRPVIGAGGTIENLVRILHSLFALLLACAGGQFCRYLHAKRGFVSTRPLDSCNLRDEPYDKRRGQRR
jgi:hypothetical protein